jgi:hypothetical protein
MLKLKQSVMIGKTKAHNNLYGKLKKMRKFGENIKH